MKYLLVVDLQQDFVKDAKGKAVYTKCLDFISKHTMDYHAIIAPVFVQNLDENINFARFVDYDGCLEYTPLDFTPDKVVYHSGYSGYSSDFKIDDNVDVIGFDTDACVLSTCFDLFNHNVNFNILTDYCYSSGGAEMHKVGLTVMKRQFGKAVI